MKKREFGGIFRRQEGISLVEILIAVFVLTIGILSCLMYFSAAINSTETARDLTVATTHGEFVLEDMRAMATLNEITARNWTEWAGTSGLNTLPQESVLVAFSDPMADPLPISVTVSWQRMDRVNNVQLETEMTR